MADFKFSDLLGLGKGMEKLIDVVSKGVGRLTKAHFDREDAKSKALEIQRLSEAYANSIKLLSQTVKENQLGTGSIHIEQLGVQVKSISDLPSFPDIQSFIEKGSIAESVKERIGFQELKRQVNIQNVTSIAAEQLKDADQISEDPVDEDWINRFFNLTQDVSNEEMQKLWGRLLAGEISRPNSFSLRTLDLIKNLTKHDAELITMAAKFAILPHRAYPFIYRSIHPMLLDQFGFSHNKISLLQELGILHPSNSNAWGMKRNSDEVNYSFFVGNVVIDVKREQGAPEVNFPVFLFTTIGDEILSLIDTSPDLGYLYEFVRFVSQRSIHVKCAKTKKRENGHEIVSDFIDYFPNKFKL